MDSKLAEHITEVPSENSEIWGARPCSALYDHLQATKLQKRLAILKASTCEEQDMSLKICVMTKRPLAVDQLGTRDAQLPERDTGPPPVPEKETTTPRVEIEAERPLVPPKDIPPSLRGDTTITPVAVNHSTVQLPVDQRTAEAALQDRAHSRGPVSEKASCPHLPLDLIVLDTTLDLASDADSREKDELRQQILGLEHEIRELAHEKESMLRDQKALEDDYCELEERYHKMTIGNRNARATPHAASEDAVVRGFMDLQLHIAAWCDEASFKASDCQLDAADLVELAQVLQLQQGLDEGVLRANSNVIGRALLFRVLVDRVFYSNISDLGKIKDLWALPDDAHRLHDLEQRLMASGLMPCDLRLWLAITARSFKASADTIAERFQHVVDDAWNRVVGLYGLIVVAESDNAAKLRQSLETNVIARAVELSYLIRTCRSGVWIRFPETLMPLNTEEVIHDPLQLRSGKQPSSPTSSSETVVCLELLGRPALLMDTAHLGGGSDEDVLYMCEKNVIYSERTQGVIATGMKQPT